MSCARVRDTLGPERPWPAHTSAGSIEAVLCAHSQRIWALGMGERHDCWACQNMPCPSERARSGPARPLAWPRRFCAPGLGAPMRSPMAVGLCSSTALSCAHQRLGALMRSPMAVGLCSSTALSCAHQRPMRALIRGKCMRSNDKLTYSDRCHRDGHCCSDYRVSPSPLQHRRRPSVVGTTVAPKTPTPPSAAAPPAVVPVVASPARPLCRLACSACGDRRAPAKQTT